MDPPRHPLTPTSSSGPIGMIFSRTVPPHVRKLSSIEVSPSLEGFAQLAKQGSWRALIDKVRDAYKHSDLAQQLLFRAFHSLALSKLRMLNEAKEEVESLGDLNSQQYKYEAHPGLYPGKTGSMVPFALRWLRVELALRMSSSQVSSGIGVSHLNATSSSMHATSVAVEEARDAMYQLRLFCQEKRDDVSKRLRLEWDAMRSKEHSRSPFSSSTLPSSSTPRSPSPSSLSSFPFSSSHLPFPLFRLRDPHYRLWCFRLRFVSFCLLAHHVADRDWLLALEWGERLFREGERERKEAERAMRWMRDRERREKVESESGRQPREEAVERQGERRGEVEEGGAREEVFYALFLMQEESLSLLSRLGTLSLQLGDLSSAARAFAEVERRVRVGEIEGRKEEEKGGKETGISLEDKKPEGEGRGAPDRKDGSARESGRGKEEVEEGGEGRERERGFAGVSSQHRVLVRMNQGLLSFAQRKFDSALEAFSAALKLEPTNEVAANNKALCHMYLRDLPAGVETLEKHLHEYPLQSMNESLVLNLCSMYELAIGSLSSSPLLSSSPFSASGGSGAAATATDRGHASSSSAPRGAGVHPDMVLVSAEEAKRSLNHWLMRIAPDDFDLMCTRL